MGRYLLWRKLATLVLLLSFVLPLSRCGDKEHTPGVFSTSEPANYMYGYKLAYGSLIDIGKGAIGSVLPLMAVFAVFFVPLLVHFFWESWQPPILFCTAFFSLDVLFHWMTEWGSVPQIGGILATECWVFLWLVSALSMWTRWRRRT